MEYNILLNSQVINEWAETGAIDPTNAILLSLLAKYDNPHNKLEHDEDGYVWLNLSYLLNQVPWLGVSEVTLGRRLKSMSDAGIIDRKQKKIQSGSKLYFKMSDLYRRMEVWYDELHALESSGDIQGIEKHYREKPEIEALKKSENIPHCTEKSGAHCTQKYTPHPTNEYTDPNTINPYTKRERKKDNTCIEEGTAETKADAGQASLPLSEKSGEDTPERKAAKLVLWIEDRVMKDWKDKKKGMGKPFFALLPEASREVKRFALLYGARWVAEEFKNFQKIKSPDQLYNFTSSDFPRFLSKAEKNKSPPPVEYLVRRKCPVCGNIVSGTMGTCGCGFEVENFDNPEAIDEHRKWLKIREEQQELEVPSLFTEFKERIRHDKTAG